jgi:hypothetical protein
MNDAILLTGRKGQEKLLRSSKTGERIRCWAAPQRFDFYKAMRGRLRSRVAIYLGHEERLDEQLLAGSHLDMTGNGRES